LKLFAQDPRSKVNFGIEIQHKETMKKVFKVFAVLAVASMLFSACKSTHSCPAYGKVVKPSNERPS
jgi:hypothetical protein